VGIIENVVFYQKPESRKRYQRVGKKNITMNYQFRGNLKGFYCGDCYDFLYNAKVKIYAVDSTANVTALAVAREKETFHQRTDEELKSISKRLIAGAFDIDFECGTVPIRIKVPPKPRGPFQFHITTLQPQWRQTENGMLAVYEHGIASSFFCRLLSLFDVWAIFGTIRDCETKKPVVGVNVFAHDVDWLQDDELMVSLPLFTPAINLDKHCFRHG
jgi:hypothetical protein